MAESARLHNTIDTSASAEIENFLRQLDETGWHNLVAIDPDRTGATGRTFPPGHIEDAAAWALSMNADGRNVYFLVNEPRPNAPDSKLGKDDIAAVRAVFIDADPRKDKPLHEERNRLLALAASAANASRCRPTHIVDSGGGVQMFWQLAEKLELAGGNAQAKRTWAEDQSRALAFATGGDAIQNIDRIMRLPGTTNFPDAKKRAHGRTPAPAAVIPVPDARTYTPEELAAYAAPRKAQEGEEASEEIAALQGAIDMSSVAAGADDDLQAKLAAASARDPALQAAINGAPLRGNDQSGSAYRAAIVARLCVAGGFTPTDYAAIVHHLPHCRTKEDISGGWARQYAREWCNIGVKHAVEHWFAPIQEADLNPFEARAEHERKTQEQAADPARFTFISLAEAADLAATHATDPLIDGLLDAGACSVLYGDSNVGKTFVALDMAYHIWAGVPYAGMACKQSDVIYVAAEGGAGILKRARAIIAEKQPTRQTGFHILRSTVNMLDPKADIPALIGAIKLACPQGAGLVVLDTLSRAMAGGDENSSTDMGVLTRNMDTLRKETGAHGMWIHHTGKNKANGARGHSILRAAIDTEIEVEEGSLAVTKQRDLEGNWTRTFALRSVELGFDANGRPIRSAVVDLGDEAPERQEKQAKLTARQADVLAAVAMNTSREGASTSEVAASLEGKRTYGSVRNTLLELEKLGRIRQLKWGNWVMGTGQDVSYAPPTGVFE